MMTIQKERTEIVLRIDNKLLLKINLLCKLKGYIRNKYLERLIYDRFEKDFKELIKNDETNKY